MPALCRRGNPGGILDEDWLLPNIGFCGFSIPKIKPTAATTLPTPGSTNQRRDSFFDEGSFFGPTNNVGPTCKYPAGGCKAGRRILSRESQTVLRPGAGKKEGGMQRNCRFGWTCCRPDTDGKKCLGSASAIHAKMCEIQSARRGQPTLSQQRLSDRPRSPLQRPAELPQANAPAIRAQPQTWQTVWQQEIYASKMHVDRGNHGPSYVVGLGDYVGGDLCIDDPDGTRGITDCPDLAQGSKN